MKDSMRRIKNSPTMKMIVIGVIIILLLLPASMINSIIHERQELRSSAIHEVSSKWANRQVIDGPVLSIPYTKEYKVDDEIRYSKHLFHILPDVLNIDGVVGTKDLTRGIYEIVVYESELNLKGNFSLESLEHLYDAHTISYDQSFLTIGMTDLRGIQSEIKLDWAGEEYEVSPGSKIKNIIPSGVTLYPKVEEGSEVFSFDYQLDLNGSSNLSFVPVGGTTNVTITSDWTSPSFGGHILPDEREVTDAGFAANWKVLELNRDFPSYWTSLTVTFRVIGLITKSIPDSNPLSD